MKKTLLIAWIAALSTLGLVIGLNSRQAGPPAIPAVTIQSLINAANDGATINIPAGFNNESLTISKNITLTGVSSSTTAIYAVTGSRVITITSGHTVVLQNLTISGGHIDADVGGGVYIDSGSSLRIRSCTFSNNSAVFGGGIFQDGAGQVDVTNSLFQANSTSNDGGGLYINDTVALTTTRIVNNTADRYGGGLQVYSGATSIYGGSFENNSSGLNGGAINLNNAVTINGATFLSNTAGGDGGGLLQWNSGQQVSVNNSRFGNNNAHNGGGMWVGGNASIVNSSFDHNSAISGGGGGVWASGNLNVTASTFNTNTGYSNSSTLAYGGGVYFNGATLNIVNTLFRQNSTSCSGCNFPGGGGLYNKATIAATVTGSTFDGNSAPYYGGGILSDSPALIQFSTFKNNQSFFGGGIMEEYANIQNTDFISNTADYKGSAVYLRYSSSMMDVRFIGNASDSGTLAMSQCDPCSFTNIAVLSNTNISANSGAIYVYRSSAVSFAQTTINTNRTGASLGKGIMLEGSIVNMTNTLIANQSAGVTSTVASTLTLNAVLYYNTASLTGGAIVSQIMLPIAGNPAFANDGYHLTAASAAIDHGVDSRVKADIDGNPRPVGKAYDLGAIEYVAGRALLAIVMRP